jgi:protein SCO1/2
LSELTDIDLVAEDGTPFRAADMRGTVWVVSFFFTTCPTICPTLTERMASIQSRLGDLRRDVALLSITVDPEHDRPEVLRAYGARFGADHEIWRFATGRTDRVSRAVVEGFRVAMGERAERPDGRFDIVHSGHFVLVDRAGRVRGYYPSSDPAAVERLMEDAGRVAAER